MTGTPHQHAPGDRVLIEAVVVNAGDGHAHVRFAPIAEGATPGAAYVRAVGMHPVAFPSNWTAMRDDIVTVIDAFLSDENGHEGEQSAWRIKAALRAEETATDATVDTDEERLARAEQWLRAKYLEDPDLSDRFPV